MESRTQEQAHALLRAGPSSAAQFEPLTLTLEACPALSYPKSGVHQY